MKRLIRETECRALTGLGRTTRWVLERRGLFPKRCRITEATGHIVGWLESDLVRWVEARAAGRPWRTPEVGTERARPSAPAPPRTRGQAPRTRARHAAR
jgi:predicted DNA-binding transcriptional regulator AlpA